MSEVELVPCPECAVYGRVKVGQCFVCADGNQQAPHFVPAAMAVELSLTMESHPWSLVRILRIRKNHGLAHDIVDELALDRIRVTELSKADAELFKAEIRLSL